MAQFIPVKSRAPKSSAAMRNGWNGSYSNRFNVAVSGMAELRAALARLERDMADAAAKEAVQAMGEPIEEAWKSKVPTGPEPIHLEDAVKLRVTKTKKGANGTIQARRVRGAAQDDQPQLYVRKQEYGPGNYPASPAARPAFDQNKARAVRDAESVLWRHARSVAR